MPSGNGQDEWTQASTPGRRKAPTAVMDDPWDVPSSPEGRPARPKIKIKVKRSGAQSDSTSDSRTTQDSQNNRLGKAPGSRPERSEDSPSGKRKRRKVDHPDPSFQGSNEVDLVAIPFGHDYEGGQRSQPVPTPSMLPPTLPVNDDVSFYIATNPLTDAQKLEYESVNLPSSDSQSHQLPPVRQFEIQNLASSGSATNVNTPRSNATFLMSTAPPPLSSAMDPLRATIGRSAGQRWDSSPDVIAAIESPPREKATRRREQPNPDDPPAHADDEVMEVQQTEQMELPVVQETVDDDYEPERVEKPAKTKKTRGRPKKKAAEEAVPLADSLPPQPEDVEAATKPKKKRGRPRKSDQSAAKEESPQVDQSVSTNGVALLSEEPAQPEKKPKVELKETESKDDLAEESKEAQDSSKDNSRESSVLKESDPNVLAKSMSSMDDDALSKSSGATTTAERGEKPEKSAISSRGSTPSKGLSAIINKPVYRVGLSKRSRIAPLLKCLRKE
ncbi:hypothetical protein ACHAPJ_005957 [Fusarium lateritium]